MASGVSGRELARRIGLSENAIRKAEKSGRIQKLPDGTYDPDRSMQQMARNSDPSKRGVRAPANPDVRTTPVRTEEDAKAAVALIARVLRAEGATDAETTSIDFNAARTADTVLKAYERDLKIAERRKELVPLARVKEHVEKAFIGIRQAIQRMPSRHVAEMAAVLGCDPGALDTALSKAIAAELNELSAPLVRT